MKEDFVNQWVETCESTNDWVRHLAEKGFPHGTWLASNKQTKGRGCYGRDWISEEGNLYFSIFIKIKDQSKWSWIPMISGLSVISSLEECLPPVIAEDIKLKWPNDIWFKHHKLGGILCEGSSSYEGVVVGIGINVNHAPSIGKNDPISLKRILHQNDHEVDLELLRKSIYQEVLIHMDTLMQGNLDWFKSYFWLKSLFQKEEMIQWKGDDGQVHSGKVKDLDAQCGLTVQTQDAQKQQTLAHQELVFSFQDDGMKDSN